MDLKDTVLRKDYLDRLWGWKDKKDVVKIITGMRRCGKSTLLEQFAAKLHDSGIPEDRIISMNFESKDMREIVNNNDLDMYLEKKIDPSKRTYVMLDEIQRVDGWERTINSLSVDYDADVYITGSNAYMLSSELSTFLSGRYVELKMLPFSFKEYLQMHPPDATHPIDSRFMAFLVKGAIPLVDPEDTMRADDLLQGIFSTIITKDVSMRLNIVETRTLDDIVRYVMDNIGNITSSASVARDTGLSPTTVKRYLKGLEDAFLIYKAYRYDVRGRRLLKTTEKYYASDTGLRNVAIGGDEGTDIGRVLENAVYLELIRRGYKVTSGSYYDKEIDFVASKERNVHYYQVALSILDERTFEREVRSLDSVPDSYPKTIITLDRIMSIPPNGIRTVNAIDWMLDYP